METGRNDRLYHGSPLGPLVRGVVLDFDGVLARSMEFHAEAYRRVLDPFGLRPTDRDVFLLEGARSETLIRELLEHSGRQVSEGDLQQLAEAKQRIFATLGPARLYDGARELVARARAAADRLGLVTGTRRENLERLIPDLIPSFDALLAQDSYRKDKPDPEPYAKAANALALEPGQCLALENAVRGVESARRADYGHVVAITTTLHEDELRNAGAHVVVQTHDEAAVAIEAWAGRPAEAGTPSSGGRAR